MSYPWLCRLLQSADPLFPIGSYAHSYGLEELAACGDVSDRASLARFLEEQVAVNLKEFELPYLRYLYSACQAGDDASLCELDREIGAAKTSSELRSASLSQGRQRLNLLCKIYPSPRLETLARLRTERKLEGHHLTIFAAEAAEADAPMDAALATWAYQAFAAPCAASPKLIRIGQEGAQAALTQALGSVGTLVRASLDVERDRAGAFLPLLDIASHRHQRAFARLFIS